jgi:hypothetical protein
MENLKPGKTVGLEFCNVPALLKDELGQPLLEDQLILLYSTVNTMCILNVHLIHNCLSRSIKLAKFLAFSTDQLDGTNPEALSTDTDVLDGPDTEALSTDTDLNDGPDTEALSTDTDLLDGPDPEGLSTDLTCLMARILSATARKLTCFTA